MSRSAKRYTFYHRTPSGSDIVNGGFRDRVRNDGGTLGVWISLYPVEADQGATGNDVVAVELGLVDEELARYEQTDGVRGFREWCIPAEILNAHPRRLLAEDEEVPSPEIPFFELDHEGTKFWVTQAPDGPENPPAHLTGTWNWTPIDQKFDEFYLDTDDEPPWFLSHATKEAAVAAAIEFFRGFVTDQ